MTTIKDKAETMLRNCNIVTLSSINEEGYPRPVAMAKVVADGISTIWLTTGADSVKTKDFLANPKAGICFYENGGSVALTGTMEIVTDDKLKQEYWQDWFINHFDKGATDPNYILLKFQANHATLYIDGEFIHKAL